MVPPKKPGCPRSSNKEAPRTGILALAQLEFIDRDEVIHFLGPPGTGKSHLATALGVEAVKAGRGVYFSSLADIVSTLAKAEREGQLRDRPLMFVWTLNSHRMPLVPF
jgi:DNA replication protein DnaC